MDVAGGLLPPYLDDIVKEWLKHDIPNFDIGGQVVGTGPNVAVFSAKSNMVTAGYPFVEAIFKAVDCTVHWVVKEGTMVEASGANKVKLGEVRGATNKILQGERTALECLTRCSAVAYQSRIAADIAKTAQWTGRVAGTRKTTPGFFRLIEKYGLLVGGVDTHRYSLSNMTMLKDNHIDACGSITAAVHAAKKYGGFSLKVEVETRSKAEALEACKAGADVIMLDNFTPEMLRREAPALKKQFPHVIIEVSGGITHKTLPAHLVNGVDILSMGCLTHGPPSVDINLKIVKAKL
eukprot:TRINITY_DN23104_c0_g1_i1.p1 TRINITY_DN23104_c0_g1~~TRINITY_DN23104_c0_g1_i1.p1  ORF type:complete len:293 (+),score=144.76 TRINITY_DN23104_c0_g1_i1:71-949(+)